MDQKRRSYGFKALTEPDEAGTFEAIVSVFGNVDEYGDRVMPGAFTKTIERTGGVFPVVWTHAWGVVPVGKTISAEQTSEGLLVKCQLLIDDHEVARQLYGCFKAAVPMEFSFSYDIKSSAQVTEDGVDILELHELDVIEVGPCLIGANRETRLIGVKSGGQGDLVTAIEELVAGQKTILDAFAASATTATEALIAGAPAADALAAAAADTSSGHDAPKDTPPSGGTESDDADTGKPEWTGEQVAEVARYLATPA